MSRIFRNTNCKVILESSIAITIYLYNKYLKYILILYFTPLNLLYTLIVVDCESESELYTCVKGFILTIRI